MAMKIENIHQAIPALEALIERLKQSGMGLGHAENSLRSGSSLLRLKRYLLAFNEVALC